MSRTFNSLLTDYYDLSGDSSTANVTRGKSMMNQNIRKILSLEDWNFFRGSHDYTSVASQQEYPLQADMHRVRNVKVYVGGIYYVPDEVTTGTLWTILNRTSVSSDVPQKWQVSNTRRKLGIYPIPSSDGNTITAYYQKKFFDLGLADYTTGTVTGASGGTAITGAGGATFTSAMIGRGIQFDGTGPWYTITAVPTSATLTIQEPLLGAVSGTYSISELVPLPDGFEELPLWWALHVYYMKKENKKSKEYLKDFTDGLQGLYRRDRKTSRGILVQDDLIKLGFVVDVNRYPMSMTQA